MAVPSTDAREFGRAICDALGLKCVTKLQISIGVGEPVVVTATMAVQGFGLTHVIRRFELHPEEKPVDAIEAEPAQTDGHDAA
jgi:hypothetical protein